LIPNVVKDADDYLRLLNQLRCTSHERFAVQHKAWLVISNYYANTSGRQTARTQMRHVFAQRIFIVIVRMCTIHTHTEFFFKLYAVIPTW